jgi:hypothetical protein
MSILEFSKKPIIEKRSIDNQRDYQTSKDIDH